MAIVNAAHFDDNQHPTITGVIGTLGTSDVTGTALTLPVSVNPTTGALYVQDLAGASGTTNVAGTVTVSGGTFNTGTVVNAGGTAGTVTGVGVVTALTNGTIRIVAGTLTNGSIVVTTGTVVNNGGTIGTITHVGQVYNAGTVQNGTLAVVTTVSNLTNGTVALAAGTQKIGALLPPDTDVTAHTNYAKKYYTSAGTVTDGIIWSPAAGKRWHVLWLFVNVSAAATVTFEDDKAGGDEVVLKMELAANSGVVVPFPEKYPLASGEDAADLIVTTSAGNIYVTCVGYEI